MYVYIYTHMADLSPQSGIESGDSEDWCREDGGTVDDITEISGMADVGDAMKSFSPPVIVL